MPAPVFIQPRATQSLSGLGALDNLEPAGVRALYGVATGKLPGSV